MKIRRFVAVDMKNALAQIKEELGSDAVIMSNKKIAEGVEIMAAVDYYPEATAIKNTTDEAELTNSIPRTIDNDVVTLKQKPQSITDTIKNNPEAPADSLSALLNRQIQKEPDPIVSPQKEQVQETASNNIELQFKNFTDRLEQSTNNRNNKESARNENIATEEQASVDSSDAYNSQSTHTSQPHQFEPAENNSLEFENMKKEMNTIRHLLEHQVSG